MRRLEKGWRGGDRYKGRKIHHLPPLPPPGHPPPRRYYLKATGEFDAAVREWENKPAADKTWQNIKTFISTEYARENKQNKLTAKNFKANMIQEQAEATEELIAALTEKHTEQMETLIKSTTEAMKEMMALIKNDKKEPSGQSNDEKKKKREERRKKHIECC